MFTKDDMIMDSSSGQTDRFYKRRRHDDFTIYVCILKLKHHDEQVSLLIAVSELNDDTSSPPSGEVHVFRLMFFQTPYARCCE